jgi:protein-S-isoprenylcysteine O-methyltransferase Ste14
LIDHFDLFELRKVYLIALQLEERDLVASHCEPYRAYQRRAGMLLPVPRSAVVPAQPRR